MDKKQSMKEKENKVENRILFWSGVLIVILLFGVAYLNDTLPKSLREETIINLKKDYPEIIFGSNCILIPSKKNGFSFQEIDKMVGEINVLKRPGYHFGQIDEGTGVWFFRK